MGFLKKALSPFVEFDDNVAPAKPRSSNPSSPSSMPSTPPPIPQTFSVPIYNPASSSLTSNQALSPEDVDKYEKHFDKLLSDANLPGPDFYEFLKVEGSLEKALPDERTRYAAAYASLAVQGLTKELLVSSAEQYVNIIKEDRSKFEAVLKEKLKSDIDSRKAQVITLQEKIAQLTKEITSCQDSIQTLNKEASEEEAKIRKNEGAYLTACDAIVNKIQSDIQKVQASI